MNKAKEPTMFKLEDSKPHPLARYDTAGYVQRVYDRREHVLRALVEHCGGADAARGRVSWTTGQKWDASASDFFPFDASTSTSLVSAHIADNSCDHVLLDGVLVWVSGYDARLQWRERFTPECPTDVVEAVPAELVG